MDREQGEGSWSEWSGPNAVGVHGFFFEELVNWGRP